MSIAPSGKSLLGDLPPAPAKPAVPAPLARQTAAALTLASGEEVVVDHDQDVLAARTARLWGFDYVVFGDGTRWRADRIDGVEPLTAEEASARRKDAAAQAAAPQVVIATDGAPTTAQDPAGAAENDLGIVGWTDDDVQAAIDANRETAKTDVETSIRCARMAGALQKRREARGGK